MSAVSANEIRILSKKVLGFVPDRRHMHLFAHYVGMSKENGSRWIPTVTLVQLTQIQNSLSKEEQALIRSKNNKKIVPENALRELHQKICIALSQEEVNQVEK